MRLSLSITLFQLGVLAFARKTDSDWTVTGITEIDVVVPKPNTTYELGPDNRFPIVIAVQNASVWKNDKIFFDIDNITTPSAIKEGTFYSDLYVDRNGPDVQYLSRDLLLVPNGSYSVQWGVRGQRCWKDADGVLGEFNFTLGPGGEKSDFLSTLKSSCNNRAAVLFNFGNYPGSGCDHVARIDPDEDAAPCDLAMTQTDIANISSVLDAQFHKACADPSKNYFCPQPPAQKKSAAVQLGTGVWLLAFSWIAFVL